MELVQLQRDLKTLIRGGDVPGAADDPYLRQVAASDGLLMVREIVTWWREFTLVRFCPLTANALKRRGQFESAVATFMRDQPISPYADEFGRDFLIEMTGQGDALLAAVSQFELAIYRVKRGITAAEVIIWPFEPYGILNALLLNGPLDESKTSTRWQIMVSLELPDLFAVTPLSANVAEPSGQPQASSAMV